MNGEVARSYGKEKQNHEDALRGRDYGYGMESLSILSYLVISFLMFFSLSLPGLSLSPWIVTPFQ